MLHSLAHDQRSTLNVCRHAEHLTTQSAERLHMQAVIRATPDFIASVGTAGAKAAGGSALLGRLGGDGAGAGFERAANKSRTAAGASKAGKGMDSGLDGVLASLMGGDAAGGAASAAGGSHDGSGGPRHVAFVHVTLAWTTQSTIMQTPSCLDQLWL